MFVARYGIFLVSIILILVLIIGGSGLNDKNAISSKEILDKIEHGEPVIYYHVIIEGDLDFSKASSISSIEETQVKSPILIIDSIINGSLYFNNTLFQSAVNLDRTFIKGASAFKSSEFKGPSDFKSSTFNGTVDFEYAKFYENANFWRSKFNEDVYFLNAKFDKNAFFIGAIFSEPAYFGKSQFNGDANFQGSEFYDFANFAAIIFKKNAYFSVSRFYLDAYFWYSVFDRDAYFEEAIFSEGCNFNAATFFGNASFNSCQFNGDAYFAGTLFKGYLDLTLTKYVNLYIRWSSINKLVYDDTAYQLLRENFKSLGLYADENECYYRYRVESRRYLPLIYKPVDWMLQHIYGYGTKPEFTARCALLAILFFGSVFFAVNGIRSKDSTQPGNRISFKDSILFSAIYFSSGATSIVSSDFTEFAPVGWSRYIAVIERLLGWALFALFLIALANTVIR